MPSNWDYYSSLSHTGTSGTKLHIHSQTLTVAPLKFRNGYFIPRFIMDVITKMSSFWKLFVTDWPKIVEITTFAAAMNFMKKLVAYSTPTFTWTNWRLGPWNNISVTFEYKFSSFQRWRWIWKCTLHSGHFDSASIWETIWQDSLNQATKAWISLLSPSVPWGLFYWKRFAKPVESRVWITYATDSLIIHPWPNFTGGLAEVSLKFRYG